MTQQTTTEKARGKHSPGPWTTSVGTKGASIHVSNDFNHPLSFRFGWPELNDALAAEGEANARLIAAAPDLLNGCNALLGLIQLWQSRPDAPDWLKNTESHRIDEARAAIAKAEGAA